MDDNEDKWTVKRSRKKTRRAKVTFDSSCGQMKSPVSHKLTNEHNANPKFATNLRALEKKRNYKEKGSAGSAPAPVVTSTTEHNIRPIDALTFGRANTVASIG